MSGSGNLESQAAQLLVQLHVTNNPAFADEDGFHDDELLMRADALGVAARGRAEAKRQRAELLSQSRNFGGAAAALSSSPSSSFMNSGDRSMMLRASQRPGDGSNSNEHPGGLGNASFEVEQFRAALRQQRAPSLRLLAAVSRTAIPALMCVVCNAQNVDSVDDFCRGGRFDALYYDAKFKTARQNEKRKAVEKRSETEEMRQCTFRPHKKEEVGAQFLAFKRGLVAPGEQWTPPPAAETQQQQQPQPQAAAAETKKDGEAEKKGGEEDDPLAQVVHLRPDAFFNRSMNWKKLKERKMERKLEKLAKEKAEEDEVAFRLWKIGEDSLSLAKMYEQKKKDGLLPQKAPPLQLTFQPHTTPFKSRRAFVAEDVLERLEMDSSRRRDQLFMREVDSIAKSRASTPQLSKTQLESKVKELYQPSPRKTPTARNKVHFETPTFSPNIRDVGHNGKRRAATPRAAAAADSSSSGASVKKSKNHYIKQSLLAHEETLRTAAVKVGPPVSVHDAASRFRFEEASREERVRKMQEERDRLQAAKDAECVFRPFVAPSSSTTPPPLSPSRNLAARFYAHLEDEITQRTGALLQGIHSGSNCGSASPSPTRRKVTGTAARTTTSTPSPPRQSKTVMMNFRTSEPIAGVAPLAAVAGPARTSTSPSSYSPARASARASPNRRRIHAKGGDELSPDSRVRRADFSPPRLLLVSPPPPAAPAVHGSMSELNVNYRAVPDRPRKDSSPISAAASSWTQTHVSLIKLLSDEFHGATASPSAAFSSSHYQHPRISPLLSLTRAIEIIHRIAIRQRITVKRLLNFEDASCLFAERVPFVDFVRLFELCVGGQVRGDAKEDAIVAAIANHQNQYHFASHSGVAAASAAEELDL